MKIFVCQRLSNVINKVVKKLYVKKFFEATVEVGVVSIRRIVDKQGNVTKHDYIEFESLN